MQRVIQRAWTGTASLVFLSGLFLAFLSVINSSFEIPPTSNVMAAPPIEKVEERPQATRDEKVANEPSEAVSLARHYGEWARVPVEKLTETAAMKAARERVRLSYEKKESSTPAVRYFRIHDQNKTAKAVAYDALSPADKAELAQLAQQRKQERRAETEKHLARKAAFFAELRAQRAAQEQRELQAAVAIAQANAQAAQANAQAAQANAQANARQSAQNNNNFWRGYQMYRMTQPQNFGGFGNRPFYENVRHYGNDTSINGYGPQGPFYENIHNYGNGATSINGYGSPYPFYGSYGGYGAGY